MADEKKPMVEEMVPLTAGRMLRAKDLSLTEQIQAHAFLSYIEKEIEKRKGELRGWLLMAAKDGGDPDPKGSYKIGVDGSEVIDEKRLAKEPDPDKFKTLLAEKKIKMEAAFTAKTEWVYDPSKVDHLVATGKIKADEIRKLCKETHALKVNPSQDIEKAIELLSTAFVGVKALAEGEKKGKKK